MSDIEREDKPTINASRRRVLKVSALALATAGAYGVAPFFGPWKHNHAWSQAGQKKPLVLGLTMDASGQYAASGMDERLGAMMAIKEINAKGGVLGRKIEIDFQDNRCNPAEAVKSVTQMLSEKKYVAIHDGLCSSVALAIMPLVERAGIPFVVACVGLLLLRYRRVAR